MFKPALAAVLVASCFSANAENIEHISIYANRTATPQQDVLASVTVLERDDIVARQANDLPALLAQLPGINLSRDGGRGQNSGLYIRGGNTGHSLVVIDGVRSGSATLGYKTLSMLPLELIERIEVVRGPRAAWYGADALSGVIAITTRKAQGVELNANVGSYGQFGADVSVSRQIDDLAVRATAGYSQADGFNVRKDLDPDRDGYDQRFAKLAADYQTSFGLLRAQFDVNSGFYQFDTGWGNEDQADTLNRTYLLGWEHQSGQWQHQAQLSRILDDDTIYGPQSRSPFVTERDEFNYQTGTAITDNLSWLGGVNWYSENVGRSGVNYVEDSRINRALFTGLNFKQDSVQLDGSVRRDLTTQYGGNNTWQLAAGYWFTDAWQLRISRGAAFKAPTFNDLYYPGQGNSNPDLAPERTLADEVAISYRVANGSVQLAWFENDIDNLIQLDENYTPQNIEQAKISGIELVVQVDVAGTRQNFAYSWIDTENTLTGQRLARRPENTVNWRGSYELNKWTIFITADYQSATYQGADWLSGNDLPLAPSHTLWGVGGSYTLTQALTLRAKVDNVFDKKYYTSHSYTAAGANFGISINYTPQ
ncbi:TonB-dependent receptor domain-containing protein [Rheinheimera metallidurans]|uniref:TonB-dependent receptor domain-containing protein n=1 Tax=Rheinheimera metallidurans TaxID=2925781 RepID=UPI0030010262